MLHAAAERLRLEGYEVIGAFVSPSHDDYVQPKAQSLNTIGLSARFRLAIARRAVADDPFVAVSAWEAEQRGRWPDFPEVCAALRREPCATGARVYYVCGSDHAAKCGLERGMGEVGVIIVPRAGDTSHGRERPAQHVFLAQPAEGEAGFSSTAVRKALQRRDVTAAGALLSAAAAALMLQPSSDEYSEYAADYALYGASPVGAWARDASKGLGVEGGLVIGITGCSRSGKGWIAGALRKALELRGLTVAVVGQDGFWVSDHTCFRHPSRPRASISSSLGLACIPAFRCAAHSDSATSASALPSHTSLPSLCPGLQPTSLDASSSPLHPPVHCRCNRCKSPHLPVA